MTTPSTKRKRWSLRFSLRSLLLVMLVLCVALGWQVERARKQRDAVEWVREHGGTVGYEYQFDDHGRRLEHPLLPGTEWLRNHLGIDFLDRVVAVNLADTQVSDLAPLAELKHLQMLN